MIESDLGIQFIGCTGFARAGKDLFCNILSKQLKEKFDMNSQVYSLAYELKVDCKNFILENLGLDVFSTDSKEKSIFRPLLVEYAQIKRNQTNGRYWLEKLHKRITGDVKCDKLFDVKRDIVIISDIRFNEFPHDEIYWVKHELQGKLVHISQYTINNGIKKFNSPPNYMEELNDPKIKPCADYCIEWEYIKTDDPINNEYLNDMVNKCLTVILK